MPQPGYHTVRTHVRRNPGTAVKKTSPWFIGAAVVAALWAWGHLGGSSEGAIPAPTHTPATSAPVVAGYR